MKPRSAPRCFTTAAGTTTKASPSIAPDTGKPLNFLQVVWGKPQRRAFEWAIDWMTRIDPYSGLLLSKHRTGLQRGRYDKIAHPKIFNTQNLPEDNEDFLARNEEAQASQLRNYDEPRVPGPTISSFRRSTLFRCSCATRTSSMTFIEPVPTACDGKVGAGEALPLQTHRRERPSRSTPSRSTSTRCACNSSGATVGRGVFPIRRAFREAYFKATPVAVDFTLCRPVALGQIQ